MGKLKSIMETLTEIDFEMTCFIHILYALEGYYDLSHEHEAVACIVIAKRQIEAFHAALSDEIEKIDYFIMESEDNDEMDDEEQDADND